MQTNQHVDAERKTSWTITYHNTVLAILSVQDGTMLDFNVTKDHLSWAIAIDSGNTGERVLDLQIPIYTLRNRTVFTTSAPAPGSPPAILDENPLINPAPFEHHESPAPIGSVVPPSNSPTTHSPTAHSPIAHSPTTHLPTDNSGPDAKKGIRMSRSAFARTGLSESSWAVALVEVYSDSEDLGQGSAKASESLDEVQSILESQSDVSDTSDDSNNYWSLQRQYEVLGESYEDYLEH